jgi:hypothetical protein
VHREWLIDGPLPPSLMRHLGRLGIPVLVANAGWLAYWVADPNGPSSLPLALSVPLLSLVWMGGYIVWAFRQCRKLRALTRPSCWRCLYDLAHRDAGPCPECGFSAARSIDLWQRSAAFLRPRWADAAGPLPREGRRDGAFPPSLTRYRWPFFFFALVVNPAWLAYLFVNRSGGLSIGVALSLPLLSVVFIAGYFAWAFRHCRKLREKGQPCCWKCLNDLGCRETGPCPGCGFPMDQSIDLWRRSDPTVRPQWTETDDPRQAYTNS